MLDNVYAIILCWWSWQYWDHDDWWYRDTLENQEKYLWLYQVVWLFYLLYHPHGYCVGLCWIYTIIFPLVVFPRDWLWSSLLLTCHHKYFTPIHLSFPCQNYWGVQSHISNGRWDGEIYSNNIYPMYQYSIGGMFNISSTKHPFNLRWLGCTIDVSKDSPKNKECSNNWMEVSSVFWFS